MAAAISGFTPTTPPTTASNNNLGQMSSGDFLNLMIQQLQQQDPLNPTDSNQLLTQMSQISTLQSNTTMVSSLSGLTLQQSIGAGANLIGKSITGLDDSGNPQTGIVKSVKVVNKQVRLVLGDGTTELPMGNLEQVNAANGTTSGSTSLSQLQQLLAAAAQGSDTSGIAGNTATSNISNLSSILNLLGLNG